MKPVPFVQRTRRLPEAGRIRIGHKVEGRNRKGEKIHRPAAIDTFRFTSQSKVEIEAIAAEYGGTVEPWAEDKAAGDQWQVTTPVNEIKVVLPPDPLAGGPVYELWGGKGRERSCDGITCEVLAAGPDGPEPVEKDCICARRGALECKPKLRLSVILPRLRFTGVWRLDTSSLNACDELPGMVDLLLEQQGRGLVCGILRLERRQSSGGSKKYVVPTLGVAASLEGLVSGQARLGALPSAEPAVPALNAGSADLAVSAPAGPGAGHGAQGDPATGTEGLHETPSPRANLDDEVIDAEVVLSLDEMIAELDVAARADLRAWWQGEAHLPRREQLTPEQEQAVVDKIRSL